MPVGSTSRRSVQVLGFASMRPLTPLCRLYPLPVRQASALPSASSRFRLATDTLAVQLTLPLAGRVEDFHLQVSAPCRAHAKKASSRELAFVLSLPRWMRRSVNLLELADRDLSIDLCRPNVGVTEHLLDETNVRTVLMHQRRQRVPE